MDSKESGSGALMNRIAEQINDSDIEKILVVQRDALARFEKTNEMLGTCCALSNHRLESSKRELIWYTQMLGEMKKDLESIFRRIKTLKQSVSIQHPEYFTEPEPILSPTSDDV